MKLSYDDHLMEPVFNTVVFVFLASTQVDTVNWHSCSYIVSVCN